MIDWAHFLPTSELPTQGRPHPNSRGRRLDRLRHVGCDRSTVTTISPALARYVFQNKCCSCRICGRRARSRVKFAVGVSNLSLVGVLGGDLVCVAVKLVKLVGTIYISISHRNNPSQPWRLDVWTVRCCVNNSRGKQLPSHTLLSLPTTPSSRPAACLILFSPPLVVPSQSCCCNKNNGSHQ